MPPLSTRRPGSSRRRWRVVADAVSSDSPLGTSILSYSLGDTVGMSVLRRGEEIDRSATLGTRRAGPIG